ACPVHLTQMAFTPQPEELMYQDKMAGFSRWTRLAALLTAFALVSLGCDPSVRSGRISERSVQRLDGQTIYKGIFLATGPVADRVPEISDNLRLVDYLPDESKRTDLLATYERVFAKMEEIEAGFFDRFAGAMQSGDHFAIEAALRSATDL